MHERHRQTDRQTDRQRSDSIGRTVLQTVAQKTNGTKQRQSLYSCAEKRNIFLWTNRIELAILLQLNRLKISNRESQAECLCLYLYLRLCAAWFTGCICACLSVCLSVHCSLRHSVSTACPSVRLSACNLPLMSHCCYASLRATRSPSVCVCVCVPFPLSVSLRLDVP